MRTNAVCSVGKGASSRMACTWRRSGAPSTTLAIPPLGVGWIDAARRTAAGSSPTSAAAIWGRMEAAGLVTEPAVLAAGEEGLRGAGLSRQKIAYAQALVEARIDYDALRRALRD